MASGREELELKQLQRLTVLKYIYDVTEKRERDPLGMQLESNNIAKQLPYTPKETAMALDYLEKRELIDVQLASTSGKIYKLNRRGREEFEETIVKPERGTGHFTPHVISLIINGNVGAVQTGADATASVKQREE